MSDRTDTRHAQFDHLRQHHPLWFDAPSASFVLTRMADARALLNDPDLWKDADQAEEAALIRKFKPADMNRRGDRNAGIGWMDDPDHARVRRPLQAALARRVTALRTQVETIVADRLATLPSGAAFDLLADYAAPIPILVIAAVLGVEAADIAQFRTWSEAMLDSFDPDATPQRLAATKSAAEAISDLLDGLMAERRRQPRDDLISDLVAIQAAERQLSDAEIRVNAMNLLVGGNVTTADLIANAVNLLLRHPDQLTRLRADPGLIGPAIEETLRFEPPTEGAQRVASREFTLHGCPVRQRQVVAVMIPAANRDPAVFPDPHHFDIGRRDGAHIAFGGGAHLCIGAPLARLEAKIAVGGLLARFPDLSLQDPQAPPAWRTAPFFHGLAHLWVRPRPVRAVVSVG